MLCWTNKKNSRTDGLILIHALNYQMERKRGFDMIFIRNGAVRLQFNIFECWMEDLCAMLLSEFFQKAKLVNGSELILFESISVANLSSALTNFVTNIATFFFAALLSQDCSTKASSWAIVLAIPGFFRRQVRASGWRMIWPKSRPALPINRECWLLENCS